MLCLSGFELHSRWVPLLCVVILAFSSPLSRVFTYLLPKPCSLIQIIPKVPSYTLERLI